MECDLPEAKESDDELNEAISSAPPAESLPLRIREARLDRALAYQAEALLKPNDLEASLGGLNGGLLRFACYLEDAFERAIAKGPATMDALRQLGPVLDAHLRVTRQIDRFAQLEVRITEARKEADDIQTKLQLKGPQGHAQDAKRKKKGLIPTRWQ